METMTVSKALSIFGLKSNYNEAELKKKYRELVKKNHPDYHMNAPISEQEEYKRRTQDINEAYEVLKKNLTKDTKKHTSKKSGTHHNWQNSQSSSTQSKNETKLTKEKITAINTIKSYYKKCDAKKLMEQIKDLIDNYILKIQISNNINITIINFKIDLEQTYRNYILLYCQKHHIPYFIMKNKKFDYDCDCSKLFGQIKDCERIISIDISKIIRKHQHHEHFKILEKQILKERKLLKEKITYDTKEDEYLKLLDEYDEKIDKLIAEYSIKYIEFKFALNKLSHQLDRKIINFLHKHINEIVLKSTKEELLEILKDAIEESKKEINKEIPPKQAETKVRETIYTELKKKYLNIPPYYQNMDIINKLFMKACELLYSEDCTLKIAYEIKELTFMNPEEEYDRLIKLSPRYFDQEYEKKNNSRNKK